MLPARLRFIGLQLLTLAYTTQSLVLITATSEDVKKLARKFVSKSLADKIGEFLELSSGKILNVSDENNFMYDNFEEEKENFNNGFQLRNGDMGRKSKLFRTTKDLNTPPVRDYSEEFEVTEKIQSTKTKPERQTLHKMNKIRKLINGPGRIGKFNRELQNIDKYGHFVNPEKESHHRHKLKPDHNEFNNEKPPLHHPHIEHLERIDKENVDIKKIKQLHRKPSQPNTDLLKNNHEQLKTKPTYTSNQNPGKHYKQGHLSNYEQSYSYLDNTKKDPVENYINVNNVKIEQIPQLKEVSSKQGHIEHFKPDSYSNFNQDQITQFQHDPVYNFRPDDIRHSDLEQDKLNQHLSGFKQAHDGNVKRDPSNDLKQQLSNSFKPNLIVTNQTPIHTTDFKLQDTENLKKQSIDSSKRMQKESLRYNKINQPLSKRKKQIAAEIQRYRELKKHGYPEHKLYVPTKPKILEQKHSNLEMSLEHTKMNKPRPEVKEVLRIDQHYFIDQQTSSKPKLDKQETIKIKNAVTDNYEYNRKSSYEAFEQSTKIYADTDIKGVRKIDKQKNTKNLEPKLDFEEKINTENWPSHNNNKRNSVAGNSKGTKSVNNGDKKVLEEIEQMQENETQNKTPAAVAPSSDLMLIKDKEAVKSWYQINKETPKRPVSKRMRMF